MDRIGFWNTRGLNRVDKQKEMQVFIHNSNVNPFGLLETKIKRQKVQNVSLNLCSGWSFTTNLTAHPAGRLWLVWKPMVFNVMYA